MVIRGRAKEVEKARKTGETSTTTDASRSYQARYERTSGLGASTNTPPPDFRSTAVEGSIIAPALPSKAKLDTIAKKGG